MIPFPDINAEPLDSGSLIGLCSCVRLHNPLT
jgi:hypothetical protein